MKTKTEFLVLFGSDYPNLLCYAAVIEKIDSTHVKCTYVYEGVTLTCCHPAVWHIAQLVDSEFYNEVKEFLHPER